MLEIDQILKVFVIWSLCREIYGFKQSQYVSCGSVFKLYNKYYEIRLHSHDVKYGSGSGQQSVTGTKVQEDHNSYWMIKALPNELCERGEPVKCGQNVRLEHSTTRTNLHSHHFTSPLSNQQEISTFGVDGEGDTGDYWQVKCDNEFWQKNEAVLFKHRDTGKFLGATGNQFGRPISGQKEIVGMSRESPNTRWMTKEGIFIEPTLVDAAAKPHIEL